MLKNLPFLSMVLTLADLLQLFNKPPQHSEVKSLELPQMEASRQVSSHGQCMLYLTGYSFTYAPHNNLSVCPSSQGNTLTFSLTEDGAKKPAPPLRAPFFCLSSWEKEPTDFI